MKGLTFALIAVAVATGVGGCASPPVGAWDRDTPESYLGFNFEPDGRCMWIGIDKKAGVGLGEWCTYTYNRESGVITIIELWDNAGARHKPDTSMLLRFDRSTDAIIWGDELHNGILQRAITLRYSEYR